ncbi:response regulator transcription factor [Amycolatopsis sp. BJA-103]|uniref:response regulator transcription factor n=1 Tax=Amycolatopsis sp. BJA-103 TaxID=1911175 RepID=UPI000C772034|nr:response regulator transcription factor [Amycolatopsis sp. BJA-103]AUI64011.1 LuxR family transcriptional regulator [Amycolatopsis sp. BJA-103]PNE16042.1 LuxR family transcriptional regulator [Amycolatopsis sp. BJA-103]
MRTSDAVTVVHGEEELFRRVGHLFSTVTDLACAANDLATWVADRRSEELTAAAERRTGDLRIRKIYRAGLLLDSVSAQELARIRDRFGAQIRISAEDVNETIIMDGRLVILAGDLIAGRRGYSVITQPETVQGVMSLFETAWRSATDLAVYDARVSEIRRLAPAVLDLLGSGVKDEAAARTLGLGVRTYRRRVAELMAALGAESRFQAGVRARELGLV